MAKLEDQIMPDELVQIIRAGTTKSEIVKQYRTSDQELAVMLLPLYRAGQLSKDEFNAFFKGLSLKPEGEPPVEAAPVPEPEAEAPSETRTRLARVFARKAVPREAETAEEAVAPPMKEVPTEAAAVPEVVPEEVTEEIEEDITEAVEEVPAPVAPPPPRLEDELEFEEVEAEEVVTGEVEAEEVEAEEIEAEEVRPQDVVAEEIGEEAVEVLPDSGIVEVITEPEEAEVLEAAPVAVPPTPATEEMLNRIMARLESIEKRLIRIEKNLPTR